MAYILKPASQTEYKDCLPYVRKFSENTEVHVIGLIPKKVCGWMMKLQETLKLDSTTHQWRYELFPGIILISTEKEIYLRFDSSISYSEKACLAFGESIFGQLKKNPTRQLVCFEPIN